MIGRIIAYTIIWFMFQLLIPTVYGRLITFDNKPILTRKQWIIGMIPVIGLIFYLFLLIREAWKI